MKLDITKPELVWPGKYDEDGNLIENRGAALPFQAIETIREGRATRQSGYASDLFSYSKPQKKEDNWHNKLIWGDNLLVMSSLLRDFAGEIDLIYIDPPFATGSDFSVKMLVGDEGLQICKEPSVIEEKAYRDTWGINGHLYWGWIFDRLSMCWELLSSKGSLFVHLDPTVVHSVKVILDQIFGCSNEKSDSPGFRNEIIWCYSGGGIPKREFPRKHDVILWYSKGNDWTFNTQYRPYSEGTLQRGRTAVKGEGATLREEGTPVNDWWPDIKRITSPTDPEKLYYDTQKSEDLLKRFIEVASNPGDLVADFFCGSGTTAAVAEKLGRRWITCDLGRYAIHTARKRLLGIPDCKPFELLNLGQYERKHWQGVEFGGTGEDAKAQSAYAAYIRFLLELYQAQPVQGEHVHGKKGSALVMVGAVDAPVTISHINDGLAECAALGRDELHVLGWEWEMGMNEPIIKQARTDGVRLRLLSIPREIMEKRAVECGDIRFFDLAYLEAEIQPVEKKSNEIKVELKDFVIPDTDLIPEDVRSKISKWSDYIDYWAIDWDYRHDTFMNQWQTYRTRKQRKLELRSSSHSYEEARNLQHPHQSRGHFWE